IQDQTQSAYTPTHPPYLCGYNVGRIGNRLFQFASLYGIAIMRGMKYVIHTNDVINQIFLIHNDSNLLITDDLESICNVTIYRRERLCCGFDSKILNFNPKPGETYRIITYLQSWKYFEKAKESIKRQFTFKPKIVSSVKNVTADILRRFNVTSRNDVVLVGLHIRRGDMTMKNTYGHEVATPEYLYKAVDHFNNYLNVIYVVCSTDLTWIKANMPKNAAKVYFNTPNAYPENDLALIASCDHVIITVGTFGWWGAWLSGGHVTFYKWPAREGTILRQGFSEDFMDFFYPRWVGY
ncbi:galactoside alpha-(1,2)-fucosyltransferase 2-like, partial [Saccostrea echinata]|uniref:galactoside alpha-(1,2)-fucosyltransferase 2-like n=1 Tax=Saccostrea echinata TaxID=191078 RepID=UPI002A813F7B